MRIALKFAYDGSKFYGYARQPNLRTVEGELIKVLIKNGIIEDTKDSYFRSASRTDKKVSAFANVISFNTNDSIKSVLKDLSNEFEDIVVFGANNINLDFNPRHAIYRNYCYYLNIKDLDVDKIISVSSAFTGKQNFTNFSRLESFKDPVRIIDNIVFSKIKDYLLIDFYAPTFLWNQIRRIISALVKIGNGKIGRQDIVEALCNPDKDVDYGLAPAEPLILKDIVYDFTFECDKEQLDKLELLKNRILNSIGFIRQ
ncbi:MAG: tRNA pseudouridine(38-40) synthase TruA [Thermoplasmatales archaeon]|nr:MAG: tRNA pseudouridine(38-40) synthase TruA [Thermoplasmatales archaeon]